MSVGSLVFVLVTAAACHAAVLSPLRVNLSRAEVDGRCDQADTMVYEGEVCEIGNKVQPTPPATSVCYRCTKIHFLLDGEIDASGADGAPGAGFPYCPSRGGHGSRGIDGNNGAP